MKNSITFLASLFFLFVYSNKVVAADFYAEYTMTGIGAKSIINKMYSKDGNIRTEINMEIGNQKMQTTSLMLKSKPGVVFTFNSMNKSYTEVKTENNAEIKDFSIKVIGTEMVGKYNCTHVRMTASGKSWDMWLSKDLPSINMPYNGNNAMANAKIIAEMKSKGLTGMAVKLVFFKPGTSTAMMTMNLTKYEAKTLSADLFKIPTGYTKSSVNLDAAKMKDMTPAQRKEMIMKMMREKMKH